MKVPWDFDPPGLERAKIQSAWGELIHSYADWTWWATLTFKKSVTEPVAFRTLKTWLGFMARDIGKHYRVAFAIEEAGGGHHVHALLAFPIGNQLSAKRLNQAWLQVSTLTGFTDIKRYDSSKGAAWYLAKEVECEVNVVCPRRPSCRRRGRCKIATSAL